MLYENVKLPDCTRSEDVRLKPYCRTCLNTVLELGNSQADKEYLQDHYMDSLKNLRNVCKRMQGEFQHKTEIIELMMICAIAQEPMLIFGPPGTAKSALVARFSELLGLRRYTFGDVASNGGTAQSYFEYLLTSFTEPDELLGPVIIQSLVDQERPRFERYKAGMLPSASVIFLDEIFRANSAILNTLLSLINERVVFEAGTALKAETLVVFGASNNVPISEELRAFYERFPIRTYSEPVPREERKELFGKALNLEKRRGQKRTESPLACLSDLAICNRAIMELWEPDEEFVRSYCESIEKLRHRHDLCQVDDRKLVKLYKIMCARALYHRDIGKPTIEDFDILRHIWADFDRRTLLNQLIPVIIRDMK